MGVISVGASLGVADKSALRAPSVSPSNAVAPSASSAANGVHASHFHGVSSAAAAAQPAYHHNHHHPRRHHEYAGHHHNHYATAGASSQQHAPGSGGESRGRQKRGGRRKYVANNGIQPPSNSTTPSVPATNYPMSAVFPPPPIVTSTSSATMAIPSTTTPSPVTKASRIGRNAAGFLPSDVSSGPSSTATRPQTMLAPVGTAVAAASPSTVERSVSFQTNAEPVHLAPFVLGAKGGSRLQAFMAQSKCTIVHRPLASSRAPLLPDEALVRVNPPTGGVNLQPRSDWRMSFTVTADSVNRVEHGIRLLHGAIETAELILERKRSPSAGAVVGQAAKAVAVDSGGNSQPSSSHTSASSAAMTDHSIDVPLPPPAPSSVEKIVVPVQLTTFSIAPSSSLSVGSNDERKAQTRIRYPPTTQPLVRGPGIAPSRSINESVAALKTTTTATATTASKVTVGKKRQLPGSGEEASESKRRVSIQQCPPAEMEGQKEGEQTSSGHITEEPTALDGFPREDGQLNHADPDFDEFRIRVTRGIEFARRVDAEAAQVSRRMMQEKYKYLRMVARARTVQHKQRVADVVIRTQCAIMATTEGNGRKRRRIEQLSAAQEAMEKSVAVVKAPRIPAPGMKRRVIQQPIPRRDAAKASETSTQFQDLLTKLAAFKALISKKQAAPEVVESGDPPKDTAPVAAEAGEMTATVAAVAVNEEKPPTQSTAEEHEYATPEPARPDTSGFRSRYLAPGVLRDLNLIQDYSNESECALLRLLTGQRQYFYLEPITLQFGTDNLDQLEHEAVRSVHDLTVLRDFMGKNRRYGAELVQQVGSVVTNTQALATSKAACWTAMQQSLVELHPLLLGAHLLALHYHAVAVLQHHGHGDSECEPVDLLASESDKNELSADLFKFVLRPIRSSAIESSLHDTLPISLVRETIAHCPEVVNHVLDWKEERDVPPELLQDVASVEQQQPQPSSLSTLNYRKDRASASSSSSSSASTRSSLLSSLLTQLQRHAGEFDQVLSDLARHVGGKGVVGDKVVLLVNQLKTVAARVLVVNTQLQLHKWTTVFVERGYSWFDEDSLDEDDLDLDYHGDDRSYDKFTCLQDALAVWHNEKLVYSTRKSADSSAGDAARETRASRKASRDQDEAEPDFGEPSQDSEELVELRRVTPADVMEIVEAEFTNQQAVASFALTNDAIGQVRKDFNDSLASIRASMKVLGRTAPWRTHLKHSNALKTEYAKQRALETKLLLHQWAVYYKTQPLPEFPEEATHADSTMSGEEKDGDADSEEKSTTLPVVYQRDDSVDVVLEPGDTPEIVDMKLLRHEIEQVAKQMQAMAPPSASEADEADRKKLLDACNLLASSCVSVLSKFLDRDEPSAVEASPSLGPRQRARANSTSRVDSSSGRAAKDGATPAKGQTPVKSTRQTDPRKTATPTVSGKGDTRAAPASGVTEASEPSSRATRRGEGPVLPAASKRTKKAATAGGAAAASTAKPGPRRPRSHSTSSASPRIPPLTSNSHAPVASVPSTNSAAAVAAASVAEPLRMGCSGCRDTRRRCTGCYGCCLHCVCLGCGCRMCCSSRMAVVQKTVNLLVTAVETRMGCKWLELDADMEHAADRCGHVKTCGLCQQCEQHCTCHPSAQASHRHAASLFEGFSQSTSTRSSSTASASTSPPTTASTTAGFPSTSSRKERRFRINPTAAQRRQVAAAATNSPSDSQSSSGGRSRRPSSADVTPTKRTRRSNSDATPSLFQRQDSADAYTTDFLSSDPLSGSSTDGMAFVMGGTAPQPPLPAQHKNEQEDLFRAARVRMKLQRNTFLKPTAATHPFGLIPPNTLIEGEMLWQPDRIRLMWERKDVYGVLGVPRDATPQLIKKQYRKLVLKLHPDKVTSDSPCVGTTAQAQNQVQQGHEAGSGATGCSMDARVAAFVAVTKAYKLLSGEIGAIHNNGWKPSAV